MEVDYSKFKIIELKNELRKLNLPLSGNKSDLINRLNNRVEKISLENCNKFKNNPNINPVTKRKISSEGLVYKKYVKECGVKKITLPKTVKKPASKTVKKPAFPKKLVKNTVSPKSEQTLKKNTTTKEEVYKFLKYEYIKNTEDNLTKSSKKEDDVLNLRVLEDKNVFYISSKENILDPPKERSSSTVDDTFGLRNFIQTHLMNYNNNNKSTKPRYVKNKGWMYYKSPTNIRILAKFQDAINKTNDNFRNYEIINDVSPKNKSFGIIGWDVPFDEPKWLIDITGDNWDRKYNPIILENNTFLFNKCAISVKSAEKAIEIIRKKSKNGIYPWKSIFPIYIGFPNDNDIAELIMFLQSKNYNTSFIGWSKHARFAYKEKDVLYIYDPWKQNIYGKTFTQIKEIARSVGYNTIFVKRPYDQGAGEGSCVNISLVRMILLSEFGKEGATMKIPYEYAILAQRLISKTR